MNDIQRHIQNMEALGDQFLEEMRELSETGGNEKIHQFKKELAIVEKRIDELDSIIMKLFEQNALGKITEERFAKMSATYEDELTIQRPLNDLVKSGEVIKIGGARYTAYTWNREVK